MELPTDFTRATHDRAVQNSRALSNAKFRLIDGAGNYVHCMDLTQRTRDRHYAWLGYAHQLKAVRKRYPETRKMRAVKVAPPSNNKPLI